MSLSTEPSARKGRTMRDMKETAESRGGRRRGATGDRQLAIPAWTSSGTTVRRWQSRGNAKRLRPPTPACATRANRRRNVQGTVLPACWGPNQTSVVAAALAASADAIDQYNGIARRLRTIQSPIILELKMTRVAAISLAVTCYFT